MPDDDATPAAPTAGVEGAGPPGSLGGGGGEMGGSRAERAEGGHGATKPRALKLRRFGCECTRLSSDQQRAAEKM